MPEPTSPGMDEVGRSRQGLFLTIPCIPAIHGGQMPEPRATHGAVADESRDGRGRAKQDARAEAGGCRQGAYRRSLHTENGCSHRDLVPKAV